MLYCKWGQESTADTEQVGDARVAEIWSYGCVIKPSLHRAPNWFNVKPSPSRRFNVKLSQPKRFNVKPFAPRHHFAPSCLQPSPPPPGLQPSPEPPRLNHWSKRGFDFLYEIKDLPDEFTSSDNLLKSNKKKFFCDLKHLQHDVKPPANPLKSKENILYSVFNDLHGDLRVYYKWLNSLEYTVYWENPVLSITYSIQLNLNGLYTIV